ASAVIPLMLLVAAVFRRSVREAFHDIRIRVARINSFLQEHLSGMRVVQLFGREEVTAGQFAVINKDHLSAHLRSITVYALFFPAVEFLGSVALGALLWYGGLRVLDQTLTVGILAAFIQLTRRFFQPLQDLAGKNNWLQSGMGWSAVPTARGGGAPPLRSGVAWWSSLRWGTRWPTRGAAEPPCRGFCVA